MPICTKEIDRSKRLLGGDVMPASNVYFNLQATEREKYTWLLGADLASSTNKSCAADSWIRWWWWQCRWWWFHPAKYDNDDDFEFDKQNFEEPLLLFLTVESTYQQRQGVTPQNALHLTPFHFQSWKSFENWLQICLSSVDMVIVVTSGIWLNPSSPVR